MTAPFLRLGVLTAAFDARDFILLSRRADLNLWTLPGGRLDAGEMLEDAAAREVVEETGVEVAVRAPVGLYYLAGWQRLNLLFSARVTGGSPRERTDETRGNRFFSPAALPSIEHSPLAVRAPLTDALTGRKPPPRTLVTPPGDLRRVKLRLGWRYVWNAMRGRPEPRFPRFTVRACAVIVEPTGRRVLTVRRASDRALPQVLCDGRAAPWEQLSAAIEGLLGLRVDLGWAGVWQDAARGRVDLVFGAVQPEKLLFRGGEWTTLRGAPLSDRDADYVARTRPTDPQAAIWLASAPPAQPGDTLKGG